MFARPPSAAVTLLERSSRAVDDPKRYSIAREKQVQADGKIADAALGEFSPKGKRYNAAVKAGEPGQASTYPKPEATTGAEVNSWRRVARAVPFCLSSPFLAPIRSCDAWLSIRNRTTLCPRGL
jgi:hypothetical protein